MLFDQAVLNQSDFIYMNDDGLRMFHPSEVLNLDCLDFDFIQHNENAPVL